MKSPDNVHTVQIYVCSIIVGTFGWVPKSLKDELQCLGINEIDSFTQKLQVFSVSGTVKIFWTLHESLHEIILLLWAWVSVCEWLVQTSLRPIFLGCSRTWCCQFSEQPVFPTCFTCINSCLVLLCVSEIFLSIRIFFSICGSHNFCF